MQAPPLGELAPLTRPTWERLTHVSLAERIEGHSAFVAAFATDAPASLAAAFPRLQAWIGRIAVEEGYALNHRKTRLTTLVVNAHPNLRRADFDRSRPPG